MKLTYCNPSSPLFEGTTGSLSIAFYHVQYPTIIPASGPGGVAAIEGMSYSGLNRGTFLGTV